MPAWLVFLLSGAVVVAAGARLSRDGDTIAERTGLGGAWVGAIFVAGATSLPELLTDIYAVRQGTPSLAVGDLFGSCMANMLILAIADLATRQVRVLTRVAIDQALVGSLGISLIATAAAGILAGRDLTALGVGWAVVAITLGYLGGMRLLYLNRKVPLFLTKGEAAGMPRRVAGLREAVVGFAVAALAILIAAPYLAGSAADLAADLGVSTGFVGVGLLAVTTSLPELVVSVSGVRRGSYDLVVGNLLGSNCFNMVVLLPLDIIDGSASLLASVQPDVLVGALFAIVLMGQVLLEVLYRAERRIWFLEPGALFLVFTYVVGLALTHQAGR